MISGLQEALISLISGCWIRSKQGRFQRLFNFITLWPQSTGIWLISTYNQDFWCSDKICQIPNWNLVNIFLDILLIDLWYPVYRFPARRYFLPLILPLWGWIRFAEFSLSVNPTSPKLVLSHPLFELTLNATRARREKCFPPLNVT